MNDDSSEERASGIGDEPLANPFQRVPVAGCLGIACVLALPALLYLPVETWNLPLWTLLLVPLVAMSLLALGAWLLSGVPSDAPPQHGDPLHPLTRGGMPPVLERPADWRNRVGVLVVGLLIALCAAGYLVASFVRPYERGISLGTAISAVGGACLGIYGFAVGTQRLAVPALHWQRIPIQHGVTRLGMPIWLTGMAPLLWALWTAAMFGYRWGALGFGLLIIGAVVAMGLVRRLPRRHPPRHTQGSGQQVDGLTKRRPYDDE